MALRKYLILHLYLCFLDENNITNNLKLLIMKHILKLMLVLVFIGGTFVVFAQDKPKIEFKELIHDFGTFKEEAGVQTFDFSFTNTGTVPLVLNSVRASCGCTTPKWTNEPVAPGKNGSIQVSYNPTGRPGSFVKSITVQSNAETEVVNLTIKGVVEERQKSIAELYPVKIGSLMAKTNNISYVKLKMGEIKTETLELVNDNDKPVTVALKLIPEYITAKVAPEVIPAKGKAMLTVSYDAGKKKEYGFVNDRIYMDIDGDANNYQNSISISATIEEDFSILTPEELANAPIASFDAEAFDFGNQKQGDKGEHTFLLKNNGKRDLIIRSVRSTCGCTAATPAKTVIPAGDTVPIKVVFDTAGKRGRQSKTITIITNDPKNPTTFLRISSNVETES
jgi:hypothetical protein